ncbi:hypothetical protein A3717_26460 [Alcanivorax sp. HI0013]|uniref:hypothetical protein n=3 Tax=Alcanivorax TaxID=59753 RepID=UPI0007B7F21C|nr:MULTISPECIES: hypothetical protein [unclassified Alcanivorax]KZX80023.1 hypothetical protein A3717_09660 [Alcanivorax sp. HI0013]KZY22663.1 hypothetical protein A3725_17300 [Alcanivorax sp. HI0035]KZX65849.1 hypothetical protein A3714_01945 [Alcanivorax sp. HI0007]KZX70856.1 hypothetical protein A3713_01415 [Alcanivorax sp. HI0003]KZX91246.1 hypothetical protein A3717_26460 [Alcanivorax sp. HI0013]
MNALEMIAALKGADEETAAELVERLQCGEIDCSVLPTGKDSAVQQAQIWAQEARTQKGIVEEIGKLVGCANDWETVSAVKAALSGAQQGEAEPVAWAVFADNGNIRIWGREKPAGFPDAVPMYLSPTVKDLLTVQIDPIGYADPDTLSDYRAGDRLHIPVYRPDASAEWQAGIPVYLHAAPQPAQVPEGWRLVPVEPTTEMLGEGAIALFAQSREPLSSAYRSMLAAAPRCPMLTAAPSGDAKREADKPINVDWPICNPACDPSLNGGTRSRGCVCEAAKASIARQSSDGDDSEGVE